LINLEDSSDVSSNTDNESIEQMELVDSKADFDKNFAPDKTK